MAKIKFREDLDGSLDKGCTHCGGKHEEMLLTSKCHPGTGLDVAYSSTGVLTVRCMTCGQEVVQVAVGSMAYQGVGVA